MQCSKPFKLFNVDRAVYPDGLNVPCGKCLACRIKKRREWVLRMTHELYTNENKGIFITLTYRDECIPEGNILRKRDLQLFLKRLRKRIEPEKIKYFACGEYGENFGRPHYHLIVFNLKNSREIKKMVEEIWGLGIIHIGSAEPDSILYVTKYVDKMFNGDEEYRGEKQVFRLVSKGIGKDFCLKFEDKIRNENFLTLKGKKVSIPRYYLKKLNIENKDNSFARGSEADINEKLIGIAHDNNELYLAWKNGDMSTEEYWNLLDKQSEMRYQINKNLNTKINLKSRGKL